MKAAGKYCTQQRKAQRYARHEAAGGLSCSSEHTCIYGLRSVNRLKKSQKANARPCRSLSLEGRCSPVATTQHSPKVLIAFCFFVDALLLSTLPPPVFEDLMRAVLSLVLGSPGLSGSFNMF
nr:hypothetical protein CFP56_73097 [Quercus suber]